MLATCGDAGHHESMLALPPLPPIRGSAVSGASPPHSDERVLAQQPRKHRSLLWLDALLLALLLSGGAWVAVRAQAVLPQHWEWGRVTQYIVWHDAQGWHAGLLLRGLGVTLRLGLWSGLVALLLGVAVGVRTAQGRGFGASACGAMVTLLRNTPPLVLLFLLYFFATAQLFPELESSVRSLPPLARDTLTLLFAPPAQVDRMLAAVLTLGLYEGAYVAEIVRAGLLSVPQGQWDAGAALGFSYGQRLRAIILPQSLPLMLPPLAGQCISTFKDSALASLISLPELTFQGMEVMSVTRLPFEAWAVTGLLYLLLSLCCTALFSRVEKKVRWRA